TKGYPMRWSVRFSRCRTGVFSSQPMAVLIGGTTVRSRLFPPEAQNATGRSSVRCPTHFFKTAADEFGFPQCTILDIWRKAGSTRYLRFPGGQYTESPKITYEIYGSPTSRMVSFK